MSLPICLSKRRSLLFQRPSRSRHRQSPHRQSRNNLPSLKLSPKQVKPQREKLLRNRWRSSLQPDEQDGRHSLICLTQLLSIRSLNRLPGHHSPHLRRVKHLKRKKIRGKLSEVWAEQTKSSQTLKLVALCHSASCLDSSSIHLTPMTTQLSVPI